MPTFFLTSRVRATYHIEIVARNLAHAKRKADAGMVPGMAGRYTAVLHAGLFNIVTTRSSRAAATRAAYRSWRKLDERRK